MLEILEARFEKGTVDPTIQDMKNISYMLTMGSPTSAITQIGDVVWAMDMNGMFGGGKGWLEGFANKSEAKVEDVGINEISAEFGIDDNKRFTQKALTKTFKIIGLDKLDRVGKEALMNSTLQSYRRIARKGTKSQLTGRDELLMQRMEQYFDGDVADVIADLQTGELTENVRILLFNTLADHQPVTLSEMPQSYIANPNGRFLWQLRSFTLKQFDIFRNQHLDMVKNGKDAKTRAKGRAGMLRLAYLYMLCNGSSDATKDLMMGRPIDLSDIAVENFMKLFGVSRYNAYQFRQQGFGEGVVKLLTPPQVGLTTKFSRDAFDIWDRLSMDEDEYLEKEAKGELKPLRFRTVTNIPVFGKFYYWHGGRGKDIISKAERKKFEKKLKEGQNISVAEVEAYVHWLTVSLERKQITQTYYENKMNSIYGQ